jgi:transmembrane sensor
MERSACSALNPRERRNPVRYAVDGYGVLSCVIGGMIDRMRNSLMSESISRWAASRIGIRGGKTHRARSARPDEHRGKRMSVTRPATVSLSPEIRAEAAAWVARLHGSGRKASLETALRTWLAASPVHAQAFELATEAWELGGAVPAAALPRIGLVRDHRPRAGWLRPLLAGTSAILIVSGIMLYLRDPAISTATGEQRSVTLEDGTRVTLNTDTRLRIHYTEQQRGVRLETGEAFFDVAKNPKRPFVVNAGRESVVALGTEFMVRRDDDEVEVTLVEGKVSVDTATAADPAAHAPPVSNVLVPGERLRAAGATPTVDRPSIDAATAWKRGEIVLDHTRLSDAVVEMNRYSPIKIALSDPESADIRVSGIFRIGDSARFARAIANTYRLDIFEEPKRILLAGAPGAPGVHQP